MLDLQNVAIRADCTVELPQLRTGLAQLPRTPSVLVAFFFQRSTLNDLHAIVLHSPLGTLLHCIELAIMSVVHLPPSESSDAESVIIVSQVDPILVLRLSASVGYFVQS